MWMFTLLIKQAWRHNLSLSFDSGWNRFDADEAGFKELHKVFKMVTDDLKQPAIVIDADDLLQNPG